MTKEHVQRRLAAILAADVAGYTRLMGNNEAGTLAALKEIRAELIDPKIDEYAGRIFKTTGDGLLVEFPSVTNAVACAVDIQRKLAGRDSENSQIAFRIGINIGDVIIDGDDVFGNGVNIAARLEGIAAVGGVSVSSTVRDHLGNGLDLDFDDAGELKLKNVERPVHAYAVRLNGRASPASQPATSVVQFSDKPSIALLPFVNLSGDPEQDYLADGLTENVITGLSRFRDLFVIASNSTFAYKGKAMKIQDASRELGVRYILEGSVQRSKERVRINAQLIDGNTGQHLWVERYDRDIDDIFAVQDDVTERIIGSLATGYGGRLHKAWKNRPEILGFRNPQALDYLVRGMEALDRYTKEGTSLALELLEKSSELNPKSGKPLAKIAWVHLTEVVNWLTDDAEASMAEALKYANLAIERDDAEAWGHYALAAYCLYRRQYDRAIAEYKRTVDLNPNDADVLIDFGYCLAFAGKLPEGLELAEKALRLNPHFPEWYMMILGQLWFDARRYDDAITALERLRTIDTVYTNMLLAASHAALDNIVEAQAAVERILQMDPQATVIGRTGSRTTPYRDANDLAHLRNNLSKAGLAYE